MRPRDMRTGRHSLLGRAIYLLSEQRPRPLAAHPARAAFAPDFPSKAFRRRAVALIRILSFAKTAQINERVIKTHQSGEMSEEVLRL